MSNWICAMRNGFRSSRGAIRGTIGCTAGFTTVAIGVGLLFPLLIVEMQKLVHANTPFKRVEFSWVLEDNHEINKTVERLGASRYKTYRIYQKALA